MTFLKPEDLKIVRKGIEAYDNRMEAQSSNKKGINPEAYKAAEEVSELLVDSLDLLKKSNHELHDRVIVYWKKLVKKVLLTLVL